ncbi:MAG: RNA polymerase sigma factor [Actinomycetota bacterium]|nr:RNA polymerase sigma factor [Actinomycetota bacterium]
MQGFETVYDEHVWDVYGFFGYRVRTREEAEDLTQTTFERALRAWDRFDPKRAAAKTWILVIARNVLIDHYRRSGTRREEPLSDEHLVGGLGRHEPYEEMGEAGLGPAPELADALGQLGAREREVIALRFGGDLAGAEIAEITGLSLANVQQILSRSLRGMRQRIEEREADVVGSGAERPDTGDAGGREREQR